MKRIAAVDERDGLLLVQSWSQTCGAHPLRVQNEWLQVADGRTDDDVLGHLVRLALAESQTGVPSGNVRALAAAAERKTLSAAGVKSPAAYERRVRHIAISLDEEQRLLEIMPYNKPGKADGFTIMAGAEIHLDGDVDDAALGREVRRALQIAT